MMLDRRLTKFAEKFKEAETGRIEFPEIGSVPNVSSALLMEHRTSVFSLLMIRFMLLLTSEPLAPLRSSLNEMQLHLN